MEVWLREIRHELAVISWILLIFLSCVTLGTCSASVAIGNVSDELAETRAGIDQMREEQQRTNAQLQRIADALERQAQHKE